MPRLADLWTTVRGASYGQRYDVPLEDPVRVLPGAAGLSWTSGISPTWSAWQQVIAATPFEGLITKLLFGTLCTANTQNGNFKVYQLGIGASGSERCITVWPGPKPDFSSVGGRNTKPGPYPGAHLPFPIYIPAGTRLVVRSIGDHASAGSVDQVHMQFTALPSPDIAAMSVPFVASITPRVIDSTSEGWGYRGLPNSSVEGVTLTQSGVAGTFGAWIEYGFIPTDSFITHQFGAMGRPSGTTDQGLIEVAIGPAGRELGISAEATFEWADSRANSIAHYSGNPRHLVVPQLARQGTRVSGRWATMTATTNTDPMEQRVIYIPTRDVVPITAVL